MKQILKNYKFYLIILYVSALIISNVCKILGYGIEEEVVQEILSCILSILISYNVITINSKKSKQEIKKDLKDLSDTLNQSMTYKKTNQSEMPKLKDNQIEIDFGKSD